MFTVLNERYVGITSSMAIRTESLALDRRLLRDPGGIPKNVCAEIPFNPEQAIENLRRERYIKAASPGLSSIKRTLASLYYLVRPVLPVAVRKHIQRLHCSGWEKIAFPAWPVDTSVENVFEMLLTVLMQTTGMEQLPFIWFWPEGSSACAMITHDVETDTGRRFCAELMDLEERHDIKSSFQLVPEQRYGLPPEFLDLIRSAGCEVNIHDLNHDGRLFRDRATFCERAIKINAYAKAVGAAGFRSAVMYRNQDWLPELRVQYDMSVPNVAHLDPQRGGCCTVFPYFLDNMIELPLTTTQDYMLFHILNDYSTRLWDRQIEFILARHGLLSFNVHPDYIQEKPALRTFECLLERLGELRSERNVWIALPRQVADWWRCRSRMQALCKDGVWKITGADSERARIAFASLEEGRLVYRVPPHASGDAASTSGSLQTVV